MEFNGGLHLLLDLRASPAGGDTARQVGGVSRVARAALFHDDEDFHRFNPACVRILFNVPGGTSSPGLPGTVTSPAPAGAGPASTRAFLNGSTLRFMPSSDLAPRRNRSPGSPNTISSTVEVPAR